MPSTRGNAVEVSTLVIKMASRCNLDCDYCYIYRGKDRSWERMPTIMPREIRRQVALRIHQIYDQQETAPAVVLHGGEPLLAGHAVLREFVEDVLGGAPNARIDIQSNGTVFTSEVERLLSEYRDSVRFSISVDGFREENDRHRRGRSGRSFYDKIERTIVRAKEAKLLAGILVVVDPLTDPLRLLRFMAHAGASHYNLILTDGDFDSLPSSKAQIGSVETGEWLWRLFCAYASTDHGFRIEFFDDIARRLVLKKRGVTIPRATFSTCTLTVDTNGEVKQSDTFRINGDGADGLGGFNVATSALVDVANSEENRRYLQKFETLPTTCRECHYLDVCGGGYPSHRLRQGSWNNPSIYCTDYKHVLTRMEDVLCAQVHA